VVAVVEVELEEEMVDLVVEELVVILKELLVLQILAAAEVALVTLETEVTEVQV
jgi:hypothetical protein